MTPNRTHRRLRRLNRKLKQRTAVLPHGANAAKVAASRQVMERYAHLLD